MATDGLLDRTGALEIARKIHNPWHGKTCPCCEQIADALLDVQARTIRCCDSAIALCEAAESARREGESK